MCVVVLVGKGWKGLDGLVSYSETEVVVRVGDFSVVIRCVWVRRVFFLILGFGLIIE